MTTNHDEEMLLSIEKSVWMYVFAVLVMLISIPSFFMEGGVGAGMIILIAGVYFFLWAYLYEGFLTTSRVVKKTGVIFKKEEEMLFAKIETTELSDWLVWQDIAIKGTGGTPITMKYVTNGKNIKDTIGLKKA